MFLQVSYTLVYNIVVLVTLVSCSRSVIIHVHDKKNDIVDNFITSHLHRVYKTSRLELEDPLILIKGHALQLGTCIV